MTVGRRDILQFSVAGAGLVALGGASALQLGLFGGESASATPPRPSQPPGPSPEWTGLLAGHRFGVALAGLEFGEARFPGRLNSEILPPPADRYAYYSSLGIKSVRLPYLWERLQPELMGPLDGTVDLLSVDRARGRVTFAQLIHEQLDLASQHGIKVLLDPHNYGARALRGKLSQWQIAGGPGRFGRFAVGTPAVPTAAFADFVRRVAAEFGDHPALMGLDIMNEPVKMPGGPQAWQDAAQAAITAVRGVNKRVPLFIEGYNYANPFRWSELNPNLHELTDPSDNLVFSAHLYFDQDHSGRYLADEATAPRPISTPERALKDIAPFFDWLDRHGKRGHIGEFGAPDTDSWFAVVKPFMDACARRDILIHAWGDWPLPSTYVLNLNPQGGPDKRIVHYLSQLIRQAQVSGKK